METEQNADTAAVEARAKKDYESLLGAVVKTRSPWCSNDNDFVGVVDLLEPIEVRIQTTWGDDLKRWQDDWLDPVYDVELVTSTPEFDALQSKDGLHVVAVDGPSYHENGGYEKPSFIVVRPPEVQHNDGTVLAVNPEQDFLP